MKRKPFLRVLLLCAVITLFVTTSLTFESPPLLAVGARAVPLTPVTGQIDIRIDHSEKRGVTEIRVLTPGFYWSAGRQEFSQMAWLISGAQGPRPTYLAADIVGEGLITDLAEVEPTMITLMSDERYWRASAADALFTIEGRFKRCRFRVVSEKSCYDTPCR